MQKDCIGSMVAMKLSPKLRHFSTPKICCSSGAYTQDPQRALGKIHRFYPKLYQSVILVDTDGLLPFLSIVKTPKLTAAHRELMD